MNDYFPLKKENIEVFGSHSYLREQAVKAHCNSSFKYEIE